MEVTQAERLRPVSGGTGGRVNDTGVCSMTRMRERNPSIRTWRLPAPPAISLRSTGTGDLLRLSTPPVNLSNATLFSLCSYFVLIANRRFCQGLKVAARGCFFYRSRLFRANARASARAPWPGGAQSRLPRHYGAVVLCLSKILSVSHQPNSTISHGTKNTERLARQGQGPPPGQGALAEARAKRGIAVSEINPNLKSTAKSCHIAPAKRQDLPWNQEYRATSEARPSGRRPVRAPSRRPAQSAE